MRRKIIHNGQERFIYAHGSNRGCSECIASREHPQEDGPMGDCGMTCGGLAWKDNIPHDFPEDGQWASEPPAGTLCDDWEFWSPYKSRWYQCYGLEDDDDDDSDIFEDCYEGVEVLIRRRE